MWRMRPPVDRRKPPASLPVSPLPRSEVARWRRGASAGAQVRGQRWVVALDGGQARQEILTAVKIF